MDTTNETVDEVVNESTNETNNSQLDNISSETVKYVQTRDPDTGQLSAKHLIEVIADNVIFDKENLTLPQKMETKADKVIYGDTKISKGRVLDSQEGIGSIAYGDEVQALGVNSTVFGKHTIVSSAEGVVTGRYNKIDSDEKYALIIGNGTLDEESEIPNRSNAFMVDWQGNVYANKFVNLEGEESLVTLRNIQVGETSYNLHGTTLHLVAGPNITLNSAEIEGTEEDGTVSHTLQVTIIADKDAAGDGSGGIGTGAYLPLIGGTEYGPVTFNTVYDRSKFTDKEKVTLLKILGLYKDTLTKKEIDDLVNSASWTPIVVGDPEGEHLNINVDSSSVNIESYDEDAKQGRALYLNGGSKGVVYIGNTIYFNPKRRNGGTGISTNSIGTNSFGWGSNVSPSGQNSVAFGSTTRAGGINAMAVGEGSRAAGVSSFASGLYTNALARGSKSEGGYTYARGSYSHVEGYGVTVNGAYSHGEGFGNNNESVTILIDNKATKDEIIEQWDESEDKFFYNAADNTHAEGRNNLIFGKDNHVEGNENLVDGECSHVEGIGNQNDGHGNHTENGYNYSKGDFLHIEGFAGKNEGYYSHVYGYGNTSIGKYNSIGGMLNESKGNKNFIFGKSILNYGDAIVAFGKDIYIKTNDEAEKDAFIFGTNIGVTDGEFPKLNHKEMSAFIIGNKIKINNNIFNSLNFLLGSDYSLTSTNQAKNNFILGKTLNFKQSFTSFNNNIILGNSITFDIDNIKDTIILGKGHSIKSKLSSSMIQGESNTVDIGEVLSNLYINGIGNQISAKTSKVFIEGFSNKIISEKEIKNIFIYGTNNNLTTTNNIQYGYMLGNGINISSNLNNFNIQGNGHTISSDINNLTIEGSNHIIDISNSTGNIHIEGVDNGLLEDAGNGTHIEGSGNKGSKNSHVEGFSNEADGIGNHIEGIENSSTEDSYYSHIEGNDNSSEGRFIHIEGKSNSGSGEGSHIEGSSNSASGENCHVEGIENTGEGKGSHTRGNLSNAQGEFSSAIGINSTAIGINSIAAGEYTEIDGRNSIGIGIGTITDQDNQYAIGKYNEYDEEALLIIGNGSSNDNRSNVAKITRDGVFMATAFKTMDGSPIGGGGSDMPIGTVITNQNSSSSGFEYGEWKKLGKQTVTLFDDNDNPVEQTLYYWKRINSFVPPEPDEKYYITDREVDPDEVYNVVGREVSSTEIFNIIEE